LLASRECHRFRLRWAMRKSFGELQHVAVVGKSEKKQKLHVHKMSRNAT
jgi:hypothetical protein